MSSRKKKRPSARSISRDRSGKSRGPLYLKNPSHAFQKTKKTPRAREYESVFREGIKLVRKLYANFDAAHGFDLRYLHRWPASRIRQASLYIGEANRLTSGEFFELYTLARPRSEPQRDALIAHTGLHSFNERQHPQKAWPIYANTQRVTVRYVKERVLKAAPMGRPVYEDRLRTEIRRPVPGGTLVHRDYLFREVLGFQPGLESTGSEGRRAARELGTTAPWEQMVRAMERLVRVIPDRTVKGNEAYYRLLSDRGPIGTSVPKHMLVERMQQWGEDYNDKFVGLLLGVRYQGDEFQAVRGPQSLDAKSEDRRARFQEFKLQRRRARRMVSTYKKKKVVKPNTRSMRKRKPVRKK